MLIGIDGNEANIQNRVGVNQFAYGLLNGIYHLATKDQFLVYLSTPPLPDLPPQKDNWHYRVIGPPKFWTQWRLPLDLFTGTIKPDVFFTPSHYAPRFSPIPTVVSIMDLGFLRTPEQFTAKDYFQLKNWTSYSIKNAHHILAISEFTKNDIQNSYQISPDKITVIYPGYDSKVFSPKTAFEVDRVLKKYQIAHPYILFISSLKPSKNVARLIEAFSLVLANKKTPGNLKLVLAGKRAWLYEDIFAKVRELELTENIVFTGYFPEEDKPYLMSGATAFVQPSLFEGFGMLVVEAGACGVPVVISPVASLSEAGGPDAIYVDPLNVKSIASGMNKVLSLNREKRGSLVQKQLNYIKQFTWEKAAGDTLAVLENVIQR